MRLAIADPPYPPLFAERRDAPGSPLRVTMRSRSRRWYGTGPRSKSDPPVADLHERAGDWDDLSEHRRLIERLMDEYDGWAIATTPDGLGAYHPLPISAHIAAWHRPDRPARRQPHHPPMGAGYRDDARGSPRPRRWAAGRRRADQERAVSKLHWGQAAGVDPLGARHARLPAER